MDFVNATLPAATFEVVIGQLPAVYAEEILKIAAERLTGRWLGPSGDFEPVRRWLPDDPTVAMAAELARLADLHSATGTDVSPTAPEVAAFLDRFGHRAPDREVDLGLPRFADDPTYVVELIRGYQAAG